MDVLYHSLVSVLGRTSKSERSLLYDVISVMLSHSPPQL